MTTQSGTPRFVVRHETTADPAPHAREAWVVWDTVENGPAGGSWDAAVHLIEELAHSHARYLNRMSRA